MRAMAAMTLVMASMACEPAPASTPPGAAVRREVIRAPEPPRDEPVEHGEERVRFKLGMVGTGPWLVPREQTTIWLEDASGQRSIPGTAMLLEPDGVFRSDWYETDTHGGLRIAVQISEDLNTTVRAWFELPLEGGGTWDVSLFVSENLTTPCMGIYVAERQPITLNGRGSMMGCLDPALFFGDAGPPFSIPAGAGGRVMDSADAAAF